IVLAEIDHALAGGVLDVGVGDVPLERNGPIQNLRPARRFGPHERNAPLYEIETAANAPTGDAPANRKEFAGQGVHPLARARPAERCVKVEVAIEQGPSLSRRNLGDAQIGVEPTIGQELTNMSDALVARSLEFLEREVGPAIGVIELFCAFARI